MKKLILQGIRESVTRFIIKKIESFLDVTPSSEIGNLLGRSRLIAYLGGVGGIISLWTMGYIADGFKCIFVLLLGSVLYVVAHIVAQFLFIDTMSSGKIDEPISPRQVLAVASWQFYYMIVLAFWSYITILGYLGDIECIQSNALRNTYLAISISIPGLAILRQSKVLRQKAFEGSQLAMGMFAEFDVTFFAHVVACYWAYSGEKIIIAWSIVPLFQVIACLVLIPDFKEQAEGVVRELRIRRTNATFKGKDDAESEPVDSVEASGSVGKRNLIVDTRFDQNFTIQEKRHDNDR